jgi:cytochrome P450
MADFLIRIAQAIALLSIYLFAIFIHRILFHPLRSFPGPKLWAATRLPLTYSRVAGTLPFAVSRLHAHYGPVVRIAPNQLSYISFEAWEDIYGFCKGTKVKNFAKDNKERLTRTEGIESILTANEEDHRRMRRLQAHAFSDRALSTQESILQDYVQQFIDGLKKEAEVKKEGVALRKVIDDFLSSVPCIGFFFFRALLPC